MADPQESHEGEGTKNKSGMASIHKLLTSIKNQDARLGLVLSVFLLLLIVFTWFNRAYQDGDVITVFQAFGAFLLISACLVVFLE